MVILFLSVVNESVGDGPAAEVFDPVYLDYYLDLCTPMNLPRLIEMEKRDLGFKRKK